MTRILTDLFEPGSQRPLGGPARPEGLAQTASPARPEGLAWRRLGQAELPALTELADRCVVVDGGQPFAADPAFLGSSYLSGGPAIGLFAGPTLLCASAARFTQAAATGQSTVTCGMVDPGWRRRGLGGQGLDWALAAAGQVPVVAESEALSDGAHALYLSRNMAQILAERVMQLPADVAVPPVVAPAGMTLTEWGAADPGRFFAVYADAFAERPGFPGWSAAEWITWISDDDDFRPEWTLLASLARADADRACADVGFIAGETTGWIAQVGVAPQARGLAVGASLVAEVARRMRAAGETTVTLNVGVNNPRAEALYRRLGFVQIGRRARYRRDAIS